MATSRQVAKPPFAKRLMGNLLALFIGLMIALLIGEIASRLIMPIFPGSLKLDKNGDPLEIHSVEPGAVYRQYSEEFDALTTITRDGYRVPEVQGDPDIVFIGDSFTFGQGLQDDDTFIMQYCNQARLKCMNLGVPGMGTITEVERLQKYLTDYKIHPKKVYLSMLVMTSFLGAGNDLNDNLQTMAQREDDHGDVHEEEPQSGLRQLADTAFKYSNLARVLKFYFMPAIKNMIVIEPEKDRLQEALKLTQEQLAKLDALSKQYHFDYKIILFHPVQDISRGSYKETIRQIQAIAPIPVVSSAEILQPDPNQYYFSLDGHFNKQGSQKIVELLKSIEK